MKIGYILKRNNFSKIETNNLNYFLQVRRASLLNNV